ncbi:uncharacterized protein PV09_04407 [Verruconis gallopava]|uniref:Xylanolytic transcriptional activator regulatory domain-containing protein n=1 Tax=Verruconis gallopava TaxID=253628 RepID=A0A0D2ACN8_9PEZI|nr:uncharacterized protein PV09_04407 [Verruconis gallopava]KIW04668.1 hypothetical protein PV09_04407 [Verruconis gallopava]
MATNGLSNGHANESVNGSHKRAVRIAGASGGFSDRQRAISSLCKLDIDFIVGDWLSECTMTLHGAQKVDNERLRAEGKLMEEPVGLFDPTFMDNLGPALPDIAKKGIKVAVNAGASDTQLLASRVQDEVNRQGLNLKVAYVEGDEVTDVVNRLIKQGEEFTSLMTGKPLKDWGYTPIYAQCYLGGAGIAEALRAGADIVVCGRVADAAPAVGVGMYWHGWDRQTDFDQIAGSLICGHLIECAAYVCGGYFSGFKRLMDGCENLGFPIAELEYDGTCVITKEPNTGGEVSVGTVSSQLLYEIQGPLYYGSDVTACLEGIKMTEIGKDRVRVEGVKGLPPPTTTKVGMTAVGGYQAEFHIYICGLDLEAKAEWIERQIRYSAGEAAKELSCFKFSLNGYCPDNPRNQDVATVDLRVFVQTKNKNLVSKATLDVPGFNRWCMDNGLQGCPGWTLGNDQRQSEGKIYYEYYVSLLDQKEVQHRVILPWENDKTIDILPPTNMKVYPRDQPSYETKDPVDLKQYGPTTRGPLGWIVGGRSGDKASDANVGFWVRHDDEWDWLRSILTIDKIKYLLDEEYKGGCSLEPGERICTQCKANNHECHFDHKDGRKSRGSSKAFADGLCQRIEQLENLLKQQGALPMDPKLGEAQVQNGEADEPNARYRPPSSVADGEESSPYQTQPAPAAELPALSQQASNSEPPSDTSHGKSWVRKLVPAPVRFDLASGRLRFFGPTTNMNLLSGVNLSRSLERRESHWPIALLIRDLSLETHDYLMDLYWRMHNSHFHLVHKDAFEEDLASGGTQFYSILLHFAMLAIGHRYADKSREDIVRLVASGKPPCCISVMHAKAKSMIHLELEKPGGIPSIQALFLLADLECMIGNDATGWMLAGMSFRLVFDVGLHVDPEELQLTERELEIRHMVLWACLINDTYYSIYMGRPSYFKTSDIAPSCMSKDFSRLIASRQPRPCAKRWETKVYESLLRLMELVGPLCDLEVKQPWKTTDAYFKIAAVDKELTSWLAGLPDELKWTEENIENGPAPLYLLHSQYHTALILLHRPFVNYGQRINGDGPYGADSEPERMNHFTILSRTVCADNAKKVAAIMSRYRQRFDLAQCFVTGLQHAGTAATALMAELVIQSNAIERKDLLANLECLKLALSEMARSYQPAVLMSSVVEAFIKDFNRPRENGTLFNHAETNVIDPSLSDMNGTSKRALPEGAGPFSPSKRPRQNGPRRDSPKGLPYLPSSWLDEVDMDDTEFLNLMGLKELQNSYSLGFLSFNNCPGDEHFAGLTGADQNLSENGCIGQKEGDGWHAQVRDWTGQTRRAGAPWRSLGRCGKVRMGLRRGGQDGVSSICSKEQDARLSYLGSKVDKAADQDRSAMLPNVPRRFRGLGAEKPSVIVLDGFDGLDGLDGLGPGLR